MSKMGEEYNKRLEKYAPDLLEACKEALDCLEIDKIAIEPTSEMHNIFRRAIAKVEGKNDQA